MHRRYMIIPTQGIIKTSVTWSIGLRWSGFIRKTKSVSSVGSVVFEHFSSNDARFTGLILE